MLEDAIIRNAFIFSMISKMFQAIVDYLQVIMKLLHTKVLMDFMFLNI
jgi:hypothetical protein